jgi:histidinol-phosphate aminotransferase
LGRYTPGKPLRQAEQESGVICIKLASNENPFGPSPNAIVAMQAALQECHLYPDNETDALRHNLARGHALAPEQVLVTAGSIAMLGIIGRTLLRPGLHAITSEHSFIIYPIVTRAAGGELITVPTKNGGFDLDGIAAAINSETRIVFLANPNNPTGTAFDAIAFDRFLDKVPRWVTLVLDEAYSDFAECFGRERGIEYSRSIDQVRSGRNVVVLRTFSKIHGLAGLRVGYGLGPPELMGYFSKMRTMFSVSAVAQCAALAATADVRHINKTLDNNTQGAKLLCSELSTLGYTVGQAWANFVYCELGEDASAVAMRLQSEGMLIRPLGPWGSPTAIRITIGTPQENEKFLSAFSRVIARMRFPKRRGTRLPAGGRR